MNLQNTTDTSASQATERLSTMISTSTGCWHLQNPEKTCKVWMFRKMFPREKATCKAGLYSVFDVWTPQTSGHQTAICCRRGAGGPVWRQAGGALLPFARRPCTHPECVGMMPLFRLALHQADGTPAPLPWRKGQHWSILSVRVENYFYSF